MLSKDKAPVIKLRSHFFDEHSPWPDGLSMTENMIVLRKGTYSRLILPVVNDSCHDITLTPRTVLGQVQLVKAVYPAEARPAVAPSVSPMVSPMVSREEPQPARKELDDKDKYDPPVEIDSSSPCLAEKGKTDVVGRMSSIFQK